MMPWLEAACTLQNAVLVTVAQVDGSGPREAGAKMVITADAQFDTIGGGHLEWCACQQAREMLAQWSSQERTAPRLERFALGPSLGQCCGGVVHVAFEVISAALQSDLNKLRQRWLQRQDTWRMTALDQVDSRLITHAQHPIFAVNASSPKPQRSHLVRDDEHLWLVDPCLAYRPHLYLFGAGHVGAAMVRALADLPCYVTWVDERDEMFPSAVPANVSIEATDTPEALIDAAPAGASFLVMTHSHALDQRLTESILRNPDAGWFGLIGSHTKRQQFTHRLRARGVSSERIEHMVCPIGLHNITGKAPAVIAASVVAQLLGVWEAQQKTTEVLARLNYSHAD